jgi:hypothetical protein
MRLSYLPKHASVLHLIRHRIWVWTFMKRLSLIVQNYISPLVLVTKSLQEMPRHLSLKKWKFEKWHVDCCEFGIKILIFGRTNSLHKILYLPMTRKCRAFSIKQIAVIRWPLQYYYNEYRVIFHAYFVPFRPCVNLFILR